MKIGGPQGPPPTAWPEEPAATAESAEAPRFGEVLGATTSPPTTDATALADASARLRAGEITATQATELVIEAVVRTRIAAATPLLAERLRETLRRMVAEDPVLASKMRKLGEGET
jgi:hypothetical protein